MLCVALVLANLLMAAAHTVDYCGAKMCGHTYAHTFCRYPPGPSSKCVGYMNAPLTADEKVRILARLNRRRSEAASGRLRHMPSAGNMLKLRWVEELAREAQRWADQCRPPQTPEERDTCRDLFSISVGQCIASVVGEAPGLRVESMVDLWYMQSMHYKENVTTFVVPVSNINYYGDFAQMIWSRSYMVGCGRSRFMAEVNGRMRSVERLVCNLAPKGPSAGRSLWAIAPPTAVCPPRSIKDPSLPALCNFQANMDVSTDIDGVLTIEEHVLLTTVLEIENQNSLDYLGSLDELYLTKLAIVTMDDSVTQALPYGNSVYKRNVIPMIVVDGKEVEMNGKFVYEYNTTKQHMNETYDAKGGEIFKALPYTIFKQKNTVGRPKPYNIEDLVGVDVEHSTSEEINAQDTPQQVLKIDRDWYLDYADVSVVHETSTSSSTEFLSHSDENNTRAIFEVNDSTVSTNTTVITGVIKTLSTEYAQNDGVIITPPTIETSTTVNSIITEALNTTRADDDYLSDPETVRELQEALERMERSLEEPPKAPGKVRRELREPAPNHNEESTSAADLTSPEEILEYIPVNKTVNKQPLLGMVLKYLPYLKPYEKEILGKADSGSTIPEFTCTVLSFDIVLIFNYVF